MLNAYGNLIENKKSAKVPTGACTAVSRAAAAPYSLSRTNFISVRNTYQSQGALLLNLNLTNLHTTTTRSACPSRVQTAGKRNLRVSHQNPSGSVESITMPCATCVLGDLLVWFGPYTPRWLQVTVNLRSCPNRPALHLSCCVTAL